MEAKETRKLDRKTFLKAAGALVTLVPLFLIIPLIRKRLAFMKKKRDVSLPIELEEGITFFPDCIVKRSGENISIFSSRCSHLGCRIDRQMGEELVCPCHGSRYSTEGKVLTGPAAKDLEVLTYQVDEKNKKIIVTVPV